MADVQEKNGPLAVVAGAALFVVFEVGAYYLLKFATSGLGIQDQMQPENTIVSNWVKTVVFLLLHLALVIVAFLVLSNQLPRRFRSQLMGWVYLAIAMSFVLLWPLFDY